MPPAEIDRSADWPTSERETRAQDQSSQTQKTARESETNARCTRDSPPSKDFSGLHTSTWPDGPETPRRRRADDAQQDDRKDASALDMRQSPLFGVRSAP